MTRKDHRPGRAWLTRAEIAAAFDVTVTHVDRTLRRFAPPDKVKTGDGGTFIYCRALLDGWAEAERVKRHPEDVLMAGGDSPALEDYRRHRARVAKVEADEREGGSVPIGEIEPELSRLTGVLRRAGEQLARQYGNDAAAILNEAVDRWEEGLSKLQRARAPGASR